ncbi:MAG: HAD hydrolase family protein [Phycisphaerales bacterium]|nr:HAD hydrolase family protein [Phycisphaerales bacterium]
MKLRVLALDYDGTIATDGRLDPTVKAALARARDRGLTLVLVTGRLLGDLRRLLGDLTLFDAVVAENGAVLAFPLAGRSSVLAPPVAPAFVAELRSLGLGPRTGTCVVELPAAAAHAAIDAIRRLELPLVCLFNRGQMMILPQAVSKATGLREALRALRMSPHNAIAVGDAENDHELLAVCEIGAAVGWGSRALQDAADLVIAGDGPGAVAGYIDRVMAQVRIVPPTRVRRRLLLGRDSRGEVVSLAVRGRNVLIAGDPATGKSWVAGLLCEQLVLQQYSVCIIDPEGDYLELEGLPGLMVLGGDETPPSLHELTRTLRHGDVSVVLDLSHLGLDAKREYVRRAFQLVTELRRETGLPHRVVMDEAHYFLGDPVAAALIDHELAGHTWVTYRVGGLHADVVQASECVIVTRETDPAEVDLLYARFRGSGGAAHWRQVLASLELDEAVLLPVDEEAQGDLRRFRIAPRLTHHVRHRHKYMDMPVGSEVAFRFVPRGGASGPVVHSLQEMIDALSSTRTDSIVDHIHRGDLSRWIGDVLRDTVLAREVAGHEERFRLGTLPDFNGAVIHAVHGRYRVTDDLVAHGHARTRAREVAGTTPTAPDPTTTG